MSTTIDERVVEMRFDHSNFKKNAGETVNLLEKLKNALNFSGSTGLDELNKSARNVDLNPLTRSIETVHDKFTAFEVAAITGLVNITNRAVDVGISLVKSLSIDQITAGWDKYAQKTSAVQTIMAATAQDFSNTGEQMEYVNGQLEKLNWFTDETSYNFVDMVSNIGKFTANNIALDKSVTAMQGIATWAALSGANATEASRAMYNLSQAVAIGSVKLIDWKSIENANMATAQFKETALETASSMGLLRKQAKGVYTTIGKGTEVTIANFNSALSEGWFTSEVLLATLDKYGAFTNVLNEVSEASGLTATELLSWMDAYRSAGDNTEEVLNDMAVAAKKSGLTVGELAQLMDELTDSTYELGEKAFRAAQEAKTFEEAINATKDAVSTGWLNTWEIVFGDYEQAKEIWTGLAEELYEVFASGAERRNELLKEALGLPDQYLDRSSSSWNNLVKQIEKAGVSGEEFANQCYEIGKQLNLLDEWSLTSFDDFRKSLENGWFTSDTLITTINSMMGPFANASKIVKDASHTFEDFQNVLGKLNRGELGEGDELLRNLAESGWNVVAVQEAANKLLEQGEVTLDDYNDALQEMSILQYKKLGYDKNTIQNLKRLRDAYSDTTLTIIDDGDAISKWWTGTELLFTGIAQAWNAIKGIFAAIGKGWEIAFPPMTAERLYGILETFKNLASSFNDWIGYAPDKAEEFIGVSSDIRDSVAGLASIFGLIIDLIKEIGTYAFDAFGGSLANGVKKVLSFTGEIGRLLVSFREWVKENNIIRTGIENITNAFMGIEARFSPLRSFLNFVGSVVQGFINILVKAGPALGTIISSIGNGLFILAAKLMELFTGGSFNLLVDIFNSGLIAVVGLQLSKFMKYLSKFVKDGSGILGGLKKLEAALLDTFKSIQSSLDAAALMRVAKAIAILAASLLVISLIDSGKLTKSLAAIGGLFIELFGFIAIFEKFGGSSKFKSMNAVSKAMIKFSAAILVLAVAMRTIAGIDADKLSGALGSVMALLGEIAVVSLLLSNYGGKAKTGTIAMIGLAAAILILSQAVKSLGSLNPEQLAKGLISVAILLGELSAFISISKFEKLKMSQAVGIVILSASLLILQKVVEKFGKLDVETLAKGWFAMAAALSAIAFAMNLIPKNSIAIGFGLIEVATSILIMSQALNVMGAMSWDEIIKGIFTLGVVLAELSFSMNLVKGALSGSAAMLIMSAALLTFVPVLKSLGGMSWSEIIKGLTSLGAGLAIIGVAGLVLAPIVPTILALSGAVALFGIAAAAAGVGILAFSTALISLAGAGAATVAAVVTTLKVLVVGFLNTIRDSASALGEAVKTIILTLCDVIVSCAPELIRTVLVLIREIITALTENIPNIVHEFLQLIIGIIDALAADIPEVGKSVVNLFKTLFKGITEAIDFSDTSVLLKGIAWLALLSLMMVSLSGMATLGTSAMIGVLKMGAVIGELALVLAAVGALASIPGLDVLIGRGGDLLQGIGSAIGQFIGGIVGGFMSGMASKFPQIATSLSDFMTNIQPFLEGAKNIDITAMNAVTALADALGRLTSWPTRGESLVQFSEELVAFGSMLVDFSQSVSGSGKIDVEAIQAAADAVTPLNDLERNLPRSGGFSGTLLGDRQTLEEFGTGIITFGQALVGFCSALSEGNGINLTLIEDSAMAASKLADLQNELPSLNGWSQKITGNPQTLEQFGTGLSTFGEALVVYSSKLSEVTDWDLFETAVTATESIVELSTKLGTDKGFINKIFGGGQTDLSDFGSTLKKFAQGLVDYSKKAAEINTNGLDNASTVISYLLGVANGKDVGNVNKLEVLGSYITGLGSDLFQYYTYISLINTEKLSQAASNLTNLVSLIQDMSQIASGSTAGFSEALVSLARVSLDDFCFVFENSAERITAAINIVAANATIAAMNASTEFETAGVYSVTAYLNGLVSNAADFTGTAKTMVSKVVDVLKASSNDYENVGKLLTKNFTNGLTFDLLGLFYTGVNLANQTLLGMAAPSVEKDSYTLGANFTIGFYNGIVSGYSLVANAAYALGQRAVSNLQAAIDAHSPSRETESLGEFAGLGFVNGILSYFQKAGDAGEGLGQEAINNLKSAIQNLPNLLENGIDLNPVIRPVIDLSGAQESTAMLNSMFNRSIGVSATLAGVTGGSFERARVGVPVGSGEKDINSTSNGAQEQSTQYNTFYITSNDPEAVANAVSYRLQKQVERKESTWAQSSGTGYPRVRSRS